jgi:outer membrane receptor protein involved in Fe transport
MKHYILTICTVVFAVWGATAQQQELHIKGAIIESSSNLPVEFATVLIADKTTEKPITGTTTNEKGQFQLQTTASNFYIEVSFIGFNTKKIEQFTIKNGQIDLGTIVISENLAELDEVVVRAEKSQTVFKLDKRVFNVGADLSSTGASALEILNNVPSVNVNIEGQISLRGSQGVQILINGKPSVLTSEEGGNALGSITADMIESIEVITNPSAKYEASGTSGIINIIMKKSEKRGLNGSVTLNTGVPNNHSIGLSLNRRTEKFNLFSQIAYGRRTFPRESESRSLDKATGTLLSSDGDSDKNENFFNLILGTDYHINDNNVLTLSGHYAFEDEKEHADQVFSFRDASNTVASAWNRRELTTATNPKWQYELQYKKDFDSHKDRSLLFSALGSSFGKDKTSTFTNTTISGTDQDMLQQALTEFVEYEYTFKLDYTHPFSDQMMLEVGGQYVINDVSNDYEVLDYINTVWEVNDTFTNVFDYNQDVLGVYGTFGYEGDKWGIKGGLRLEHTNLKTELQNTGERNNQDYTNLFPSLHTSYKLTEDVSLQAGYSRRIYRPNLWSLNPFVSFRDNFNLSTGNPNLQPEFTDSYEIASIVKFEKGSFNFGLYYRDTDDVIERIATFEDNVTTTRPENVGTNRSTGAEFNAKYNMTNWLTFTADVNYNYFNRKGQFDTQNFDFSGDQWSSRVVSKIKLPADFRMEITGNYRSKYQDVQSEIDDNIFMDLGVRKKLMKGRLNLNLSVRDVFASRIRRAVTDQLDFNRYSYSKRGRFITFGISYGFGKGEAMEYSGQKRF